MNTQPDRSFDGLGKAAIELPPTMEADADEAERLHHRTDRVARSAR